MNKLRGILSLQSEVAYGHVGNGAARFALQRLGFEVWSLATVLYSNHPGHGRFAGEPVAADKLAALVDELEVQGRLADCDAVLSGYLGAADQAGLAADIVARVRSANPDAFYACDPVMGDLDTGAYVRIDVANGISNDLAPMADILFPNAFELAALSGQSVDTTEETILAARSLVRPIVICTSAPGSTLEKIAVIAVTSEQAWRVETDRVDDPPHGLGDLLAALFLGQRLLGRSVPDALSRAVGSVDSILRASVVAKTDEMILIEAQDRLIDAPPILAVEI
jgi:pyridoxine kinase